jgi:GntR family transcriptional repressor for pyruvate dehydrogenase complex
MFSYLQYKRIHEEVVDVIIQRIRSGALIVGEKLPPERVLADEMGVSRTSLRALESAEMSKHLIKARRNLSKNLKEAESTTGSKAKN